MKTELQTVRIALPPMDIEVRNRIMAQQESERLRQKMLVGLRDPLSGTLSAEEKRRNSRALSKFKAKGLKILAKYDLIPESLAEAERVEESPVFKSSALDDELCEIRRDIRLLKSALPKF